MQIVDAEEEDAEEVRVLDNGGDAKTCCSFSKSGSIVDIWVGKYSASARDYRCNTDI